MSTKEQIRRYILENFAYSGGEHLADEASLIDAGIIDSTGVMELVSFLEDEFGIAVDDLDLVPENLDSVSALSTFVARKRAVANPADAPAAPAAS